MEYDQTKVDELRCTTRNIRKPGIVSNIMFCRFTQNRNALTILCFEIPASAYCQPLAAIIELQNFFKIELYVCGNL